MNYANTHKLRTKFPLWSKFSLELVYFYADDFRQYYVNENFLVCNSIFVGYDGKLPWKFCT